MFRQGVRFVSLRQACDGSDFLERYPRRWHATFRHCPSRPCAALADLVSRATGSPFTKFRNTSRAAGVLIRLSACTARKNRTVHGESAAMARRCLGSSLGCLSPHIVRDPPHDRQADRGPGGLAFLRGFHFASHSNTVTLTQNPFTINLFQTVSPRAVMKVHEEILWFVAESTFDILLPAVAFPLTIGRRFYRNFLAFDPHAKQEFLAFSDFFSFFPFFSGRKPPRA
jgi:hypothetical protein